MFRILTTLNKIKIFPSIWYPLTFVTPETMKRWFSVLLRFCGDALFFETNLYIFKR